MKKKKRFKKFLKNEKIKPKIKKNKIIMKSNKHKKAQKSTNTEPCSICQMIGHSEGFCATYYQKIKIFHNSAKTVSFWSSINNWQRGEKMEKKNSEEWILKKIFPIGSYEFKFKIDNDYWVISDLYDWVEKDGNVNNCIFFDAYHAENIILSNFTKNNKVFLKMQFSLKEWNLQMILKKNNIFEKVEKIQIAIFGSWDNWKNPIKMKKIKKNNYTLYIGKKIIHDIPKGIYQYKFKIQKKWLLDLVRNRKKDKMGNLNHFFKYKDQIPPKTLKIKINYKKICLNELGLKGLRGHSLNIVNDKIYIIGGISRNSYSNTIYTINLKNWQINEIDMHDPNGPDLIAFHKTILYGDKIIVYGGQTELHITNKYHTFNTFTKKWTFFNLKNNIKKEQFSSAYKKDSFSIYFFGGYYYHPDLKEEKTFNDLSVLHLDLMSIETLPTKNKPKPRLNHSANMFNWHMYIFGGTNIKNYKYDVFNDLHKIDLSDHEDLHWEEIRPKGLLPRPRYGHLALAFKNQIILHGGKVHLGIGREVYFEDFWVFDVLREEWSEVFYLEGLGGIRRAYHSGSVYKEKLFIFGGDFSKEISQCSADEVFVIPLL